MDDTVINGNATIGPLAKWLMSGIAILIVGWLGFISVMLFNHISASNTTMSQIATDVVWIKSQAMQGGRFTAEDAAKHDARIKHIENCCEKSRERIIRMEAQTQNYRHNK